MQMGYWVEKGGGGIEVGRCGKCKYVNNEGWEW